MIELNQYMSENGLTAKEARRELRDSDYIEVWVRRPRGRVAALPPGTYTMHEMADITGLSMSGLAKQLNRMKIRGTARRISKGKWKLT